MIVRSSWLEDDPYILLFQITFNKTMEFLEISIESKNKHKPQVLVHICDIA